MKSDLGGSKKVQSFKVSQGFFQSFKGCMLVQRRRWGKCGCYVDTGSGDFMKEVKRRDGAKDGCNADRAN
jgi:hypothetical protein